MLQDGLPHQSCATCLVACELTVPGSHSRLKAFDIHFIHVLRPYDSIDAAETALAEWVLRQAPTDITFQI